jgi:hypothetical protein
VTEAKRGPFDTIAKHKLACAVWAVRCNIPDAIPIIAVYLRVTETDQGIEFNAAECTIDDGRDGLLSLHSVEAVSPSAASVAGSGSVSPVQALACGSRRTRAAQTDARTHMLLTLS